jgi:hypothetical protein
MAYFEEGSEAMLQLEGMVDRVGLRNVLSALEYICQAKAEHLAVNWQDTKSAKEWERAARKIYKVAYGSNMGLCVDTTGATTNKRA